MHQNQPKSWLIHIRNHSWCWDKPRATRIHLTNHGPDSGEATTFPHIIFSTLLRRTYIRMAFWSWDSQGVPKLFQIGLSRLWELITPSSNLWLGWGLKQTCSSLQELSNGVSHSTCTHRGRVDSRLLVVESQTKKFLSLFPTKTTHHNYNVGCLNVIVLHST